MTNPADNTYILSKTQIITIIRKYIKHIFAWFRQESSSLVQKSGHWQDCVRRHFIDLLYMLILFILGMYIGTSYVNQNGLGSFFQQYFGSVVMFSCGKGYQYLKDPIPENYKQFLAQKIDHFDCEDIPDTYKTTPVNLSLLYDNYQYLSVGLFWKIAGISWSGLSLYFGLFYGLTMLAAYSIFRLGLKTHFAFLLTFLLLTSPNMLFNLPTTRDFPNKLFFYLAFLLLGILIKKPFSPKKLIIIAGLYGLIVGIGYGFRSDVIIALPIVFIVIFLLLPAGILKCLKVKIISAFFCIIIFLIFAYPKLIITANSLSCHLGMLGFSEYLERGLPISNNFYDTGILFADNYINVSVAEFEKRVYLTSNTVPGVFNEAHSKYCWLYYFEILKLLPADQFTRVQSVILTLTNLRIMSLRGFETRIGQNPFLAFVFNLREFFVNKIPPGKYYVLLTVIVVALIDLRIGFFLLLFVLYFCGYNVHEYMNRIWFHLEIIPLWAFGFLIQTILLGGCGILYKLMSRRFILMSGIAKKTFADHFDLLMPKIHQYQEDEDIIGWFVGISKKKIDVFQIPNGKIMIVLALLLCLTMVVWKTNMELRKYQEAKLRQYVSTVINMDNTEVKYEVFPMPEDRLLLRLDLGDESGYLRTEFIKNCGIDKFDVTFQYPLFKFFSYV
jgi:hypothetical protein